MPALFITHTTNCKGDITETIETHTFSMASTRLQLLPAFHAFREKQLEPRLFSLDDNQPNEAIAVERFPEIIVFGKLSSRSKSAYANIMKKAERIAIQAKYYKSKIISIYCDHILAREDINTQMQEKLLKLSDKIVVPCNKMKLLIQEFNHKCEIIEDPWQIEALPYSINKKISEPKILWFGHQKNIQYLIKAVPDIFTSCSIHNSYHLSLLSSIDALEEFKSEVSLLKALRKWTINYIIWNPKNYTNQLKTLMTKSDITLIPSDSQDIFKAAASHNRVIDSIQGACIPIASPISSYKELSKLCYLTNDFGKAVDHVSKNFKTYSLHASLIREEKLKHFSPTSNKVKWIELISELMKQTV